MLDKVLFQTQVLNICYYLIKKVKEDFKMGRGGSREGAGRKSTGKPTTKATIYVEDRELLNSIAKDLNIPVNELIHRVLKNNKLMNILEEIKSFKN